MRKMANLTRHQGVVTTTALATKREMLILLGAQRLVLRIGLFSDHQKSTWSRAQIVEENQPECKFKILREGESEYHAEWVEIFSDRIAPHNTKTRAAQKKLRKFQKRLKVGDELDARTGFNRTWYPGTVIEFRTNDQNVEEMKVKFNSHIVDSWVPRYGKSICSTLHAYRQENEPLVF